MTTQYNTDTGGREWLATGGGYTGMSWDEFLKQAAQNGFQQATLPDDMAANPFIGLNPNSTGQNYFIGRDPENANRLITMLQGQDGGTMQLSSPDTNPAMMKAIMASLAVMSGGMLAGGAFAGLGAGAGAGSSAGYLGAADAAAGLLPEFGTFGAYEAGMTGAGAAAGSAVSGGAAAGTSASGAGEIGSQFANETAKFAAQNAAAPGSLLNTSLPTAATAAGGGNALSSLLSGAKDFLGNPLVQVGTSLVSGIMGDRAASRAADAQTAGIQSAIDSQNRQFDLTRADLAPYRERGYQANNRLAMMMGMQPNAATYKGDMATYKQDPIFNTGYQSAAKYQPGETANALSRYLKPLGAR
jgi:hypothetical protein